MRGARVIIALARWTSAVANVIKILPDLEERKLNVKIICAVSPELFAQQSKEYQDQVITPADRADSTFISTSGARMMEDWTYNDHALEYAMTTDWDGRWRTGGSLDEVLEEAHLSPKWLLVGIERFVGERAARLKTLQNELDAALKG